MLSILVNLPLGEFYLYQPLQGRLIGCGEEWLGHTILDTVARYLAHGTTHQTLE
jgi:hypothetical protein